MRSFRFWAASRGLPAKSASVRASALTALREISGEQIFSAAALRSPDRRELFAAAASLLQIDEYVLLEMIACKLELPLAKRVTAPASLPQGIDFSELRSGGCVPAFENGAVSELICVDPAFIGLVARLLGPVSLRLARWKDIRTALDESETALEKLSSAEVARRAETLRTLGTRALAALINQAGLHKQFGLQIFDAAVQLTYEYSTENGKCARGSVHGQGKDALLFLLEEIHCAEKPFCISPNEMGLMRLKVERLNPVRFLVSWRLEEPELQPGQAQNLIPFPQPRALTSEIENSAVPVSVIAPTVRRNRVLIVDDNATFVRVLERFFDRHELEVEHALDGEKALEVLRCGIGSIDLVVCDVHMPRVNGDEFLKRLREQRQFEALPVVMLTSDNDVEVKMRLLEAGADAYVTKNEDPRLLCVQVKRLISKRRNLEAA